jgi:hypothetical protein
MRNRILRLLFVICAIFIQNAFSAVDVKPALTVSSSTSFEMIGDASRAVVTHQHHERGQLTEIQQFLEEQCELRLDVIEDVGFRIRPFLDIPTRNHWNDRQPGVTIDTLFILFSCGGNAVDILRLFTCPEEGNRTSVHFLILRRQCFMLPDDSTTEVPPTIIQLVGGEKRAWSCRGQNDGSISIMIEHCCNGFPVEDKQQAILKALFQRLDRTYGFRKIVLNPKERQNVNRQSLRQMAEVVGIERTFEAKGGKFVPFTPERCDHG